MKDLLPDVLIIAGLLLLTVGLGAYDWRLACVVFGGLLMASGIIKMLRDGP